MPQEHPADTGNAAPMAFLAFGATAVGLQRELLQTYARLSRIWLERMQVEMALWTGLVCDLAASNSPADVLKAYSDRMTRQFRMSAEDGRHIFDDYREIAEKIARVDAEDMHAIHDLGPESEHEAPAEIRVTH